MAVASFVETTTGTGGTGGVKYWSDRVETILRSINRAKTRWRGGGGRGAVTFGFLRSVDNKTCTLSSSHACLLLVCRTE